MKLDHVVWKGDVYAVIAGLSDKSPSTFADHTMCRLGKWYQSKGKEQYGNQHAFKQLDKPHATVHKMGLEAMQAAQANQFDKAQTALEAMETASQEVMRLLDELQD
ncbi:CZB domain-containing protein [Aestuariibacter sp. AA17]|uniref:CZB domain-containing protein n=1 Tax=Fluctibacter corallii TaxID=2984329 RepID=A0ABT3A8G1_9ALTE|nr:CZB domain-containing protein [Aestuariibacter sp. AA17]